MHKCSLSEFPHEGYGSAITLCEENEKGEFWAGNMEYGTRVNFCPLCGSKAPLQFDVDGDKHALDA